jgi:acyl transferase domain-containing protein
MSAVAIVGIACLFPRAGDLCTFWKNILAEVDAVSEASPEWDAVLDGEVWPPEVGGGARRGGFLGELAAFDPLAFGVMPKAIDGGEPEHFLALRVAHDALADAGYLDRDFDRTRAAVILGRGTYVNRGYVSVLQHTITIPQVIRVLRRLHPEHGESDLADIRRQLTDSLPPFTAETSSGLIPSVMCGRIANRLDLMGPAFAVDAACASSLIALQLGMRELDAGAVDLALVGGVQVSTTAPINVIFARLGGLSRTGRIRPFHRDADGTVLGEGVGILVIRRLADAARDGDRIYAIIRSVGTASDGRALGVLAPRVEGEELALRRAYATADVSPDSVDLIEAHGTGTPAGDAAELGALSRLFGQSGEPTCALGSVKSMIGHTIPAAGAAGLIKAALALHHRVLPPTLAAEAPHPALANTRLRLNAHAVPWLHGRRTPRRAGVSAFGFGGINAHAVLEEHPLAA